MKLHRNARLSVKGRELLVDRVENAHPLGADVEVGHHVRREPVGNAREPEQHVLGADVVMAQRPRFVLGEGDRLACPLCERLEYGFSIPPTGVGDKRVAPPTDVGDRSITVR